MYCTHCGQSLPEQAKFCLRCGQAMIQAHSDETVPIATFTTPAVVKTDRVELPREPSAKQPNRPVTGWLWLFCVLLVVIFPLAALLYMWLDFAMLTERIALGPRFHESDRDPVYFGALATLVITIYGIAVGARLWSSFDSWSIGAAKLYLLGVAVYAAVIILLIIFNDERPFIDEPAFPVNLINPSIAGIWIAQAIQAILTFAIWFPFLKWSRQIDSLTRCEPQMMAQQSVDIETKCATESRESTKP